MLPEYRLQDYRILHTVAGELSARDIPFPIVKSWSPFEISLYDCRPQNDFRYFSHNQNTSHNQKTTQILENNTLFTHFNLKWIGTNNHSIASETTIQQRLQAILSELEMMGVHINDFFKENRQVIGFNMLIFNQESLLEEYLMTKGSLQMDIGGLYNALTNTVIINASNPTLIVLNNIQHEATHAFTQHIWGKTPIWFNEGLSSYFENLSVRNNLTQIQQDRFYLNLINHLYQTQQLIPLKIFIPLNASEWHNPSVDKNQLTIFYATAWSLMYFIVQEHSDLFFNILNNSARIPVNFPMI